MTVQKDMIGKTLIFRLTNKINELGEIEILDTELRIKVPNPEEQNKTTIRGAC